MEDKLKIFDKKRGEEKRKRESSSSSSSINELNKMIAALMENSSVLDNQVKSLSDENKTLKEKLSTLKRAEEDMKSYQAKFNDIFKEYTTLEMKNQEIVKDLEEKNKKIKELTEIKSKTGETIKTLEDELLKTKGLLDEATKEKDLNKKEIEYLKNMSKDDQVHRVEMQKHQVEIERNQLDLELKEHKDKLKVLSESNEKIANELNNIKAEHEKNNQEINAKVKEQEIEIKKLKEELEQKTGAYNDISNKLNESLSFIKKLQTENQEVKSSTAKIKSEAFSQVEALKDKLSKASESLFSQEQIKELYSEHLHMLYGKEYSLSYHDIIDKTIVNFNSIVQGCFNANNQENVSTPLTIMHENIKDIYFLIYARAYYNKLKCSSSTGQYIPLNSLDVPNEMINEIAVELFAKNLVTKMTHNSKEIVDAYLGKISSMKLSEDIVTGIKESFVKKVEKTKHSTVNSIRALVEKCAATIVNGTIELNKKMLFDFRTFMNEEITIAKGNLFVDNTKLTNESAEGLMNIIKFPRESIVKIQFVGKFDFTKITEGTVMKILLCIMCYLPNILSLSITSCDKISYDLLCHIIFIVSNLKLLKILNLENNHLTDEDAKVVSEGLKNNRSIVALFLGKNDIGSEGALYISDCLSINKVIERLFLGNNHLCESGLNSLLTIIATVNQKVNYLDLSYNNLTNVEFTFIGEFLNKNPLLVQFNLSGNPIEMHGCIRLGTGLSNAKRVKNINLSKMNIIADTSPFLFKTFSAEDMNIDDNLLEEVGYIMFAKAISGNTTLKKLSCKNTGITLIGLTHFLAAVEKNPTLIEIHMENNKLDEKGCEVLNKFVKGKNKKFYLTKADVVAEKFKDPYGKVDNVIFV